MATRRLRQAAATAFGWIVVFDALHVYWELGGRFGFGDQADPLPSAETAWQRVFAAVVLALFVVGTVLPLAFVQRWGRRIPRRILITMAWVAAGLLTVRAVAAFVDDAMRTVFGSPTGLTGLTYEQLLGTAAPSAHTLWSARTIDCTSSSAASSTVRPPGTPVAALTGNPTRRSPNAIYLRIG